MITVSEEFLYAGRPIKSVWNESIFYFPESIKVNQVTCICLNDKNEVLIVKNKKGKFAIPGGHIEQGESFVSALIREVYEEAYVKIDEICLAGYVVVSDLNSPENLKEYLHLRYAARVNQLDDFKAENETSDRLFCKIDELPYYIPWLQNKLGRALIEAAYKYIRRRELINKSEADNKNINFAIPVYNEEDNLPLCIKSIDSAAKGLVDSGNNISVFLSLNGCTDKSLEVAESLKDYYPHLKFTILQSLPGSMYLAEKKIINEIDNLGPVIFLDADAQIEANALSIILSQYRKHDDLLVVGGHPYPKNTNKMIDKILNCRAFFPMSEKATTPHMPFHPFYHSDPQSSILEDFEKKSKIYFHGRFFSIRSKLVWLHALFEKRIGEDTFLTYMVYHYYGLGTIRLRYDAKCIFSPISNFKKHFFTYRRIFQDINELFLDFPALKEFQRYLPTSLDWRYIRKLGISNQLTFLCYAIIRNTERIIFKILPKALWQKKWS